jgi:hypothetical protein
LGRDKQWQRRERMLAERLVQTAVNFYEREEKGFSNICDYNMFPLINYFISQQVITGRCG